MGLDMYLHKKTYIGNKWRTPDKQVRVVVPQNQDGVMFPTEKINEERICGISEEVACWRKANAIHAWFVAHVQNGTDDCGAYSVSREQLQELLDTVTKVLDASELVDGEIVNGYGFKNGKYAPILEKGKLIKDPAVAKELLPTQAGFFFGSTQYDHYYIDDLRYTRERLKAVLKEDGDFSYQASW